jgi:hypothetical protein
MACTLSSYSGPYAAVAATAAAAAAGAFVVIPSLSQATMTKQNVPA